MQSTNPGARLAGHALAGVVAIAAQIGGIAGLMSRLPPVMGWTMLVTGTALELLVWRSMKFSRAAWSFIISILAILATVTFFGAPKIRHVLDISLGLAFVIPVVMVVAVVVLAQARADYRGR